MSNKPMFCIVGETGAGKSTLLDKLMSDILLHVYNIIPSNLIYYTNRAKRDNEKGASYYFISKENTDKIPAEEIIEKRTYNTKNNGIIDYFTTYSNIEEASATGNVILCAASVDQAIAYYNKLENVYFIIVKCKISERLKRVINRDDSDPACLELCRRVIEEKSEIDHLNDYIKDGNHIILDTSNVDLDDTNYIEPVRKFMSSKAFEYKINMMTNKQ